MKKIVMYTTGCPQCEALAMRLKKAGVDYDICSDAELMTAMGMTHVPMLQVEEELMDYKQALKWIEEN